MKIIIDKLDSDNKPLIIMFDEDKWTLYVTEFFKGNPNELIGVIQNNVFIFLKRENLSLSDFKFIVYNTDHVGFEVNCKTEYKMSE